MSTTQSLINHHSSKGQKYMKTSRAILLIALLISFASWDVTLGVPKRLLTRKASKNLDSLTVAPSLQPSARPPVGVPATTTQDIGPGLGFVDGLSGFLIDPGNPNEILVSTDIDIFKSNDAGQSWHTADIGLESHGSLAVLTNIRSDPNNPRTVYAVGDPGLFRSTDFGEHWTQLSNLFGLRDLAVSATSPNTLFVVGPGIIYKSTDGGTTLVQQTGNGLPDSGVFTNVVFTPADPLTLYVVDEFSGVYKSTDGGTTFNLLFSSPLDPGQVFPHPTQRDTIFLETLGESSSGLFRSTDGGTTFHQVTGGLPAGTVQFVTFDPADPLTLYASATEGLLRSTDGGITFTPLGITPDQLGAGKGGALTLAIDPANSKVLYVNTAKGNFKSTNRGRSFAPINDGFHAAKVIDVEFDNNRNLGLYVVANDTLFRTSDGGQHYTELNVPPRMEVTAVALAKTDPDTLVITTFGNGILRSTNGGRSWTKASIDTGQPEFFDGTHIAIDPTDARYVYVLANTLYRSIDGGQTFSSNNTPAPFSLTSVITLDPQQPKVIFVSGGNGLIGPPLLLKSSDGGTSFVPVLTTLGIINGVVVDPHNSNIVYAAGVIQLELDEPYPLVNYPVVKSFDGGATFTAANTGIPNAAVRELVIDPLNSSRLFAVAGGLFSTQDGATSWTLVDNAEITRRSILADVLAINPRNPKLVYLGGASLIEVETAQ
jgi:photosystem II stability/assembly factor-like uncharacterized protein